MRWLERESQTTPTWRTSYIRQNRSSYAQPKWPVIWAGNDIHISRLLQERSQLNSSCLVNKLTRGTYKIISNRQGNNSTRPNTFCPDFSHHLAADHECHSSWSHAITRVKPQTTPHIIEQQTGVERVVEIWHKTPGEKHTSRKHSSSWESVQQSPRTGIAVESQTKYWKQAF